MKILVTGGTGYIGSHTIVDLMKNGFEVICVDNQSNSEIKVLDGIEAITGIRPINYSFDLCNRRQTEAIFEHHDVMGIVHFAAYKSVGESVNEPLKYFHNNLNSLMNLLHCVQKYNVSHFVFSSSCSVYGNAKDLPVTENTPMAEAECPYARTKQIGEQMISDISKVCPESSFVSLRYFNPAGAHDSNLIGESPTSNASNLVPVITETAMGKREMMTVFGNDYDTRDGSCIRDYIHVMDLANAHTKSIEYLQKSLDHNICEIINLGIGEGVSVFEAINAFEKVNDVKLNYKIGPRRAGDVVSIYANKNKALELLNWKPQFGIEDIMKTAWNWEKKRSIT